MAEEEGINLRSRFVPSPFYEKVKQGFTNLIDQNANATVEFSLPKDWTVINQSGNDVPSNSGVVLEGNRSLIEDQTFQNSMKMRKNQQEEVMAPQTPNLPLRPNSGVVLEGNRSLIEDQTFQNSMEMRENQQEEVMAPQTPNLPLRPN